MSDEFGLPQAAIDQIREVLARHGSVERATLYGSRAKGNFKPGSDIDLTLTGPNLATTDLLKIAGELDDLPLPYRVDLSLIDTIEDPNLIEHIERVGIIFYRR